MQWTDEEAQQVADALASKLGPHLRWASAEITKLRAECERLELEAESLRERLENLQHTLIAERQANRMLAVRERRERA